ncbi:MAG: elongation factor Ts [Candidatus Dojkabacteria bacterium]|nr:elongation factor Ts [Candidatus Dojkabacteria bacterium]MDQ7021697.1 elongation factor Ts [Candidatus Dojkabacteria bacterium]
MEITIDQIKKLREMSGAGVGAVRESLTVSNGDEEAAMKFLREKGVAKADKRKGRAALNGVLGVYVHSNNKVVVVVEVNCETDFAAKSPELLKFANDIALQVAAANPTFISRESVDADLLAQEKDTFLKELEGKPEGVKEKILEGKLEKFYTANALLEQTLFTDETRTVKDYISELVAKIGEKVEIKQFSKFEVAQDVVACKLENTVTESDED